MSLQSVTALGSGWMPRGSFIAPSNQPSLSACAPYSPLHTGQWAVADFLPFLAKPTVATLRPLGTPDSPVAHRTVLFGLMTVGLADVVGADCAADRWLGAQLAHRTVRCTPYNPVIYSHSAPTGFPRAACSPRASLGTGQSGAPRLVQFLYSNLSSFGMIHSTLTHTVSH
jgi:hypothetical protein